MAGSGIYAQVHTQLGDPPVEGMPVPVDPRASSSGSRAEDHPSAGSPPDDSEQGCCESMNDVPNAGSGGDGQPVVLK